MTKETIAFDDFQKLELKIGTILECEKVENSNKLLKMQVDLGEEKRQIISGIAKYYLPEELVGKQVVVLANLEARKIMGKESEGMILAADISEEEVYVLSPDRKIVEGAIVR